MKSLGQNLVRWKGHLMLGIWIVIAIAGAYIILAGFLFIFQSRYVYYPERVLLADPGSIGLDFETVRFETADGVKLSGWFYGFPKILGRLHFTFSKVNLYELNDAFGKISITQGTRQTYKYTNRGADQEITL